MNIVVESTIIPAKQISKRSIQVLTENNLSVDSIHTNGTYKVSIRERNLNIPVEPSTQTNFRTNKLEDKTVKLNCNGSNDHSASIASNSHQIKGIGNIRCSIWTLGRIACVFSLDLIGKFADDHLKENRVCLISPREVTFNLIHIVNINPLAITESLIVPFILSWYTILQTIEFIIDFIFIRLFDSNSAFLNYTKKWEGLNK